jgi:hypothetical protein
MLAAKATVFRPLTKPSEESPDVRGQRFRFFHGGKVSSACHFGAVLNSESEQFRKALQYALPVQGAGDLFAAIQVFSTIASLYC